MPTVELDIRQLADEGGTAPLAPITVTDAVLDENGDTLTDTLDTLKNGLTPSAYTAPTNLASGITFDNGGYALIGNLVVVNCRFNVTTAKSGTTAIATFPAPISGNGKISAANNKKLDIGITFSGALQTSENISTGTLIVTTCYLKG